MFIFQLPVTPFLCGLLMSLIAVAVLIFIQQSGIVQLAANTCRSRENEGRERRREKEKMMEEGC